LPALWPPENRTLRFTDLPCAAYEEDVDDFVDVHGAEAVFVAVFEVAGAGVDREDAFAGVGVLLVDDDDAGGDAGAVEEVGGEADDAFDVSPADEIAADFGFGVASEEDAVGEDAGSFAAAF
jgi:hypothetical protein